MKTNIILVVVIGVVLAIAWNTFSFSPMEVHSEAIHQVDRTPEAKLITYETIGCVGEGVITTTQNYSHRSHNTLFGKKVSPDAVQTFKVQSDTRFDVCLRLKNVYETEGVVNVAKADVLVHRPAIDLETLHVEADKNWRAETTSLLGSETKYLENYNNFLEIAEMSAFADNTCVAKVLDAAKQDLNKMIKELLDVEGQIVIAAEYTIHDMSSAEAATEASKSKQTLTVSNDDAKVDACLFHEVKDIKPDVANLAVPTATTLPRVN